MATIKYRKREFTPNQNQQGMSHCIYAESVIVNELDTIDISRLIEARTGVRRYEAQSVLASFVELINEECAQSMRIKLTDEEDTEATENGTTNSTNGTNSGNGGNQNGGNQSGGSNTGGDNGGNTGGDNSGDDNGGESDTPGED